MARAAPRSCVRPSNSPPASGCSRCSSPAPTARRCRPCASRTRSGPSRRCPDAPWIPRGGAAQGAADQRARPDLARRALRLRGRRHGAGPRRADRARGHAERGRGGRSRRPRLRPRRRHQREARRARIGCRRPMISARTVLVPVIVVVAVAVAAERPAAWGFEAHRLIADRAVDLLPAEIRPFFVKHRAFISEHAIDPDLWRTAGWIEEPPQHFLDMDAYGPAPFDAIPHDKDAAIAKFGKDMVQKNGLLPWRVDEMYSKLVRAFADAKADRPYARD